MNIRIGSIRRIPSRVTYRNNEIAIRIVDTNHLSSYIEISLFDSLFFTVTNYR